MFWYESRPDIRHCFRTRGALQVIHEGYVVKQGGFIKNWKLRYMFLLAGGVLLYMKTKEQAEKIRGMILPPSEGLQKELHIKFSAKLASMLGGTCGSVRLANVVEFVRHGVVAKKPNCWGVKCATKGRMYYFSSPSSEEVDRWEQAISSRSEMEEKMGVEEATVDNTQRYVKPA